MSKGTPAVIPCCIAPSTKATIASFANALRGAAPQLGNHGLSPELFWDSGIFRGAIEQIRGEQAASMKEKRAFIREILNWLKEKNFIHAWGIAGNKDRHDYEVIFQDNRICAIEAKGCLDGQNTNIFERPANADEFVIWSLCQNAAADPRKNAWSGIHTRLSAEIVHRRIVVDGLIIWDSVCNTVGRPCPKVLGDVNRVTQVGLHSLPPPCLYLFPRTVPDPRNNKAPNVHKLVEVRFLKILQEAFRGEEGELTEVAICVDIVQNTVARSTKLTRDGTLVKLSKMTKIKRAKS